MRRLLLLLIAPMLLACGGDKFPAVDTELALAKLAAGAAVIDVRTAKERESGVLPNAIPILHTEIVAGVTDLGVSKDQSLVLYCRSGRRSGIAVAALREAGYTEVTNGGGYAELHEAIQRK